MGLQVIPMMTPGEIIGQGASVYGGALDLQKKAQMAAAEQKRLQQQDMIKGVSQAFMKIGADIEKRQQAKKEQEWALERIAAMKEPQPSTSPAPEDKSLTQAQHLAREKAIDAEVKRLKAMESEKLYALLQNDPGMKEVVEGELIERRFWFDKDTRKVKEGKLRAALRKRYTAGHTEPIEEPAPSQPGATTPAAAPTPTQVPGASAPAVGKRIRVEITVGTNKGRKGTVLESEFDARQMRRL